MKKSKKLLSLFLAALMLMSCFGAISASAMTNEAAEAAAAEFNANIPDHSGVYQNLSAKQWKSTKEALNKTLAEILKKNDVRSTIYSDATVSMILTALCSAIAPDTILVGMTTESLAAYLNKNNVYPENAAYLATVADWKDVDASKLVWNITPGNEEQFITALGYALGNNIGSVFSILTGPLGNIGSVGAKAFNNALAPLLEAFHQGAFLDFNAFKAAASGAKNNRFVEEIVRYLCGAINAFLENPVTYLCEILPDLVYTYPKVREGLNIKVIGYNIGDLILPLLPENADGILKMVLDALGMNLNLKPIDETHLYTMGSAVIAESGRGETETGKTASYAMRIEGDSTMVFAALAQYVGAALQDQANQVEIGRFVVSKIGPEYEDNYLEIVEAAKNGTALDVADSCLSLVEELATNIGAQEDVNPVVAFFAKIAAFFSNLAKKIIALFK